MSDITDILRRLRDDGYDEAADEIERLRARLAEATQLLEEWHRAYHADQWGEGVDDDTTTWLAGISPFKDRAADSADAGQT